MGGESDNSWIRFSMERLGEQLTELRREFRDFRSEVQDELAARMPMMERDRASIRALHGRMARMSRELEPAASLLEEINRWRVRLKTAMFMGAGGTMVLSTLPRETVIAWIGATIARLLDLLPGIAPPG